MDSYRGKEREERQQIPETRTQPIAPEKTIACMHGEQLLALDLLCVRAPGPDKPEEKEVDRGVEGARAGCANQLGSEDVGKLVFG
eukprot:7650376-Alexandrium_andersonii.AAC.1